MVKNLPAVQETQILYLGSEDLLQKGMATHSSILAWKIPWTEEYVWLQSFVNNMSQMSSSTFQHFFFSFLNVLKIYCPFKYIYT